MATTVILTETEKIINNNGDTIQTIFTLTKASGSGSSSYTFDEKNILIKDHGYYELEYDLKDMLLIPSTVSMTVYDGSSGGGWIHGYIFENSYSPEFKVEIKINGITEFIGHVIEDSLKCDIGLQIVTFTAKPNMDILINKACYGDNNEFFDPLNYTTGDTENITNAECSVGEVTITHDANGQYNTGTTVLIEDVLGMTDINGYHIVASEIDNTQFKINLNTEQSYVSGGTATLMTAGGLAYNLITILEDIYQLIDSNIKYWTNNFSVKSTLTDATNLNGIREVVLTSDENYAVFCAFANDAITVIDISDLDNPVLAGTVSDGTNLNEVYDLSITSDDNYIIATARASARLTIVDISTPTSPSVAGTVTDADLTSVRGIAITSDDNYAVCCGHDNNSVVILDISDKTTPIVVGTITDDYLDDVFHVAITSDDNYAICTAGTEKAVVIIDISTPASPSITGVCIDTDLGDGDGNDIILTSDDNYAIVNGKGVNSLVIVDISTPAYPFIIGSIIDAVNLTNTRGLALTSDENYIIVTLAGDDQITVVDITTKAVPIIVGSFLDSDLNTPVGITLTSNNDYAIIAANIGDTCTIVNLYAAGSLKIDQNWTFNTFSGGVVTKDISAAEYTELLDQGDCEAGDGIPEINGQDLRVQACTIAQSAVQKHGGANSCKITSDGITASVIRAYWAHGDYDGYLVEEKAHIIEVWVWIPSGNTDITELTLIVKDIDNNLHTDSTTDVDNWTKLSVEVNSISDDENFSIRIDADANGDETAEFFYIDDFSIKPKTILTITHTTQDGTVWGAGDLAIIKNVTGMTDLNGIHIVQSVPDNDHINIYLYTTQTYTSEGEIGNGGITKFFDLYLLTEYLFFDNSYGISNCGDLLKKMAIDWFCFAGMIHEQKAFFYKLFYYNSQNVQTLGTVLKHSIKLEYPIIEYVKMRGFAKSGNDYETFVIAGNYTTVENKRLIREETIPEFWNTNSGFTNVINSDADGIYYAYDPDVCNGEGEFHKNIYLLTELWYNNRSDIDKCRIESFTVKGIDYDFLKNFVYNNHKYQIMRLKKMWNKNETEIDAINLGGV